MRYRTLALVFGVVTSVARTSAWTQTKKTDAQIRQDIVTVSIAPYEGDDYRKRVGG